MAAKLTRRTLSDQVAEQLIDYIIDKGLQDGDSLPSTAELADQFGVSRTVIREGLADLAGRGVLHRSQGRECVVTVPGSDVLRAVFDFRIQRNDVSVLHTQEFREAIEVSAARLAAERRTDDDIRDLEEAFEALAQAKRARVYHDADMRFHRHIAQASGNPLLSLILDSVESLVREHIVKNTAGTRRMGAKQFAAGIAQHRAILEAIKAGEPDSAAEAMVSHMRMARRGLKEFAKKA